MAGPSSQPTDPSADDPSADESDAGDDSGGSDPQEDDVVATITRTAEGAYKLIPGDEDEDGGEDEGQTFNSLGELLKGVMDTVKTYEANMSGGNGGGGSEAQFQAGYAAGPGGAGGAGVAATAPPMAARPGGGGM